MITDVSKLNQPKLSIKSILLAAIGGQGGNVLIEWLFLAAERDGRRAQALSLPGLSQRGGGTNFYLEIASLENRSGDKAIDTTALEQAQFAQFPFPGRVDVLLGQELVELGRLVQGGFASRRTTVVASSQRVFTIGEKMPAWDGVFPSDKIIEATAALAGSVSVIDTSELAKRNGLGELATNAILLGALSAVPEALPIEAHRYREAIQQFGLAVEMNLAAFEVGREYQLNFNQQVQQFEGQPTNTTPPFALTQTIPVPGLNRIGTEGAADSGGTLPPTKASRQINLTPVTAKATTQKTIDNAKLIDARGQALPLALQKSFKQIAHQIEAEWPIALQPTLIEAAYQLTDYQNSSYIIRYLELVEQILEMEQATSLDYKLTETFARVLAMRMTYEDATRVAMLKLKPGRLERIRRDMGVKPGQVLQVTDYLKPDMAEIYGIFPAAVVGPTLFLGKITGIGFWLGRRHFTLQQHPQITTPSGYMTFRFLTWFKPLRLSSYRFRQEWKLIQDYQRLVLEYSRQDYELGLLIAESGRLVKGYGDTRRKMISTMQRFYNILAPLTKWEANHQKADTNLPPFAVSRKAVQLGLQLIGRNDEGIERAESLAAQLLTAAKAGTPREKLLVQVAAFKA